MIIFGTNRMTLPKDTPNRGIESENRLPTVVRQEPRNFGDMGGDTDVGRKVRYLASLGSKLPTHDHEANSPRPNAHWVRTPHPEAPVSSRVMRPVLGTARGKRYDRLYSAAPGNLRELPEASGASQKPPPSCRSKYKRKKTSLSRSPTNEPDFLLTSPPPAGR